MRKRADPRLHDEQLWAEIELYVDVLIAATETSGPLGADRLDRVLGLPETVVPLRSPHPVVARVESGRP